MTHESKQKAEQVARPRQQEFNFSPDELSQAASELRGVIDDIMLTHPGAVSHAHIKNLDEQEDNKKSLNVLTLQRIYKLNDGSRLVAKIESTESLEDDGDSDCKVELVAWGDEDDARIKDVHIYTVGHDDIVRRYDITEDEWTTQLEADTSPLPSDGRAAFEQSVGLNNLPVGLDEVKSLKLLLTED